MSSRSSVDAWLRLGCFQCCRSAEKENEAKRTRCLTGGDRLDGRAGARPYRILDPYLITLTGVPNLTAAKNRLAFEPGIRMHPCEAG
jgi:hypothetical protein